MRNLIIIIVTFISINIEAQNKIDGRVLEIFNDGSSSSIFGANVFWENTNIGTTTDINGNYSISGATSFPATLSVSYVGYSIDSKEVIDNKYIFYLKKMIALDEVQIKSQSSTTKISTINTLNTQTLKAGELKKAACCDLSGCFETNNTVDVVYSDAISGIKKIQMLGLDGTYVQITNENIPLIRGMMKSYGLSYVPGSWIESIQIIKGMGSVINGYESLTGQINLEYFKPSTADRLSGDLHIDSEGMIESNLMLTKKQGNWRSNLFLNANYFDREIDHAGTYHDHTNHTDYHGDGFIDMPKVKKFNLLNRWQYFGSDKFRGQFNVRALIEERLSGQKTEIVNPYIVDIHNDFLQLYTKLGTLSENSIGLQTSFKIHNQDIKFGKNIYIGTEESMHLNLIKESQLRDDYPIKYGLSYYADRLTESFEGNTSSPFKSRKRLDLLTGAFIEQQYLTNKLNIITGIRLDYYNIEDILYFSPRLNIKYNPTDRTAIRLNLGNGFRISNSLLENIQYLGSSRNIIIAEDINVEKAFNSGLNIAHCFYLFGRETTLNFDLYRTNFKNQVIVDVEDENILSIYNLDGKSYSNSLQIDLIYQFIDRIETRFGYKITDARSNFNGIEKMVPLTPKTRGLLNISYESISKKWVVDFTANYIGKSRIPEHSQIIDEYSDVFYLFNTNITRRWDKFELYIGGENLSNYTQNDPIISADNPDSDDFDASLIWAPIMGRLVYAGIRYNIK